MRLLRSSGIVQEVAGKAVMAEGEGKQIIYFQAEGSIVQPNSL